MGQPQYLYIFRFNCDFEVPEMLILRPMIHQIVFGVSGSARDPAGELTELLPCL